MYLLNHSTKPGARVMEVFTFHYVSIKSRQAENVGNKPLLFTFHYVSIKSQVWFSSTTFAQLFTFHYVSIKSFRAHFFKCSQIYLHSTMYLLNHISHKGYQFWQFYLHSTMYLLNLNLPSSKCFIAFIYIPLCIY